MNVRRPDARLIAKRGGESRRRSWYGGADAAVNSRGAGRLCITRVLLGNSGLVGVAFVEHVPITERDRPARRNHQVAGAGRLDADRVAAAGIGRHVAVAAGPPPGGVEG